MMGILGCFLGRLLVVPYKQFISEFFIIFIFRGSLEPTTFIISYLMSFVINN